jgi:hypothetical protein
VENFLLLLAFSFFRYHCACRFFDTFLLATKRVFCSMAMQTAPSVIYLQPNAIGDAARTCATTTVALQ